MEKIALLLAAGTGVRWEGVGYPKQMHPINGTAILHRTVRQLRERNIKTIIVANDVTLGVTGIERYEPGETNYLVETTIKTEPLWKGHTIALLADVAFTEEAMDTILDTEGLHFFGRARSSSFTGGCPEVFAWAWDEEHSDRMMTALQVGLAAAYCRDPAGYGYDYMTGAIWQPYHALIGQDLQSWNKVDDEVWIEIDDFTDDVDYPDAGRRLARIWERHQVP